jgi:CelD/BcsL family acetyltransferase involved in cellulose biosynthesis
MSSGTRQKLGQKARKLLAAGGEDAFRLYQTPTEVTEFLRLAQELAPRTYQARLLGAQLGTNAESIDRVKAWAQQGSVIAATVVLDGRTAAFWVFRLLDGGVLESVYTGYDTEFDKLSPGTVLVYLFLERCFFNDPRFTLLDWTEGDADYKRLFSNESLRCADLMYFRSRPRFLWLLTLDVAVTTVSATTRPVIARLERGGYASAIRRWLRRQPPADASRGEARDAGTSSR